MNAKGIAELHVATQTLNSERVPCVQIRCRAFKGDDGAPVTRVAGCNSCWRPVCPWLRSYPLGVEERYLSAKEVSERLVFAPGTLENWQYRGKGRLPLLVAVRCGR